MWEDEANGELISKKKKKMEVLSGKLKERVQTVTISYSSEGHFSQPIYSALVTKYQSRCLVHEFTSQISFKGFW